jgi:SAM-dependent methyltransferase
MIPINLNLGCGQYPKDGYLNIDLDPRSKADKFLDLNKFPYQLPSNHFELVEAFHLLEHLDDPIQFMQEAHRILKPGGCLHIRVPHFSRGFTHWQHKRGFDVSYPLYFRKEFQAGYVGVDFDIKKIELHWFCQLALKKKTLSSYQYLMGRTLGKIFDFFANLSPYACSRIWCFWVGGFEEVEFIFLKR